MRRKPEPEGHVNHERWLVSYGDLLTLLFAVFVVLYAMSYTDKKKVEAAQSSIRESFGYFKGNSGNSPTLIKAGTIGIIPEMKPNFVPTQAHSFADKSDFRKIKDTIEAYLGKTGNSDIVAVKLSQRGLVISLKEAGFFDSGSAELKNNSRATLTTIAETLSPYENMLRIEGHTDNLPIHSIEFRSNWELSSSRAINVLHFLTEKGGVAPDAVSAIGYGKYRPISTNASEAGRARNRRVDLVLLAREAEQEEAPAR